MKKTKKTEIKVAATILLHNPGAYTKDGAREVAAWMRKQAAFLVRYAESGKLGRRFRARYYYYPA